MCVYALECIIRHIAMCITHHNKVTNMIEIQVSNT